MILEIHPHMTDMRMSRAALGKVMEKLGIRDYKVCSTSYTSDLLTIEISEEDALIFELAGGAQKAWEIFIKV